MPTVLITGATGFVGSELIRRLSYEYDIYTLGRRPWGTTNIYWDMYESCPYTEILKANDYFDVVVHAGSLVGSGYHWEDYNRVNVEATAQLAAFASRYASKFIFLSTGSVYGPYYTRQIDEFFPVHPNDDYSMSKMRAERRVSISCSNATILRLFYPYGWSQKGRLIPNLIEKVKNGSPIKDYGGKPRINPIHVTDVSRYIEWFMDNQQAGVFNVAGREIVSIRGLVTLIGAMLGKEPVFETEFSLFNDLIGNTQTVENLTGIKCNVNLRDGIYEMIH